MGWTGVHHTSGTWASVGLNSCQLYVLIVRGECRLPHGLAFVAASLDQGWMVPDWVEMGLLSP